MDKEILKLLKLSSIPGFKLSQKEQEKLDAWKNAQETTVVKKPRRTRRKNIVTNEEKTLNRLES